MATVARASAATASVASTAMAVETPPAALIAFSAVSVSFCAACSRLLLKGIETPAIGLDQFQTSMRHMPKSPPPQWRRRDCSFDHLVEAAVNSGWGKVLVYQGVEDIERAQEIRRGIYRCAGHRGITAEAGTVALRDDDDSMGIRRERDGTYTLKYRVWTKQQARKAHLARYGSDRAS